MAGEEEKPKEEQAKQEQPPAPIGEKTTTPEQPKSEQPPASTKLKKTTTTPEQTKGILDGKYYSVQDLAKHFGYSRAWISHLINAKIIKATRPTGNTWRISESEFQHLAKEGLAPKPRVKPKHPAKKIPLTDGQLDMIAPNHNPPLEAQESPGSPESSQKKEKYKFSFLPFSDLD